MWFCSPSVFFCGQTFCPEKNPMLTATWWFAKLPKVLKFSPFQCFGFHCCSTNRFKFPHSFKFFQIVVPFFFQTIWDCEVTVLASKPCADTSPWYIFGTLQSQKIWRPWLWMEHLNDKLECRSENLLKSLAFKIPNLYRSLVLMIARTSFWCGLCYCWLASTTVAGQPLTRVKLETCQPPHHPLAGGWCLWKTKYYIPNRLAGFEIKARSCTHSRKVEVQKTEDAEVSFAQFIPSTYFNLGSFPVRRRFVLSCFVHFRRATLRGFRATCTRIPGSILVCPRVSSLKIAQISSRPPKNGLGASQFCILLYTAAIFLDLFGNAFTPKGVDFRP